MSLLAETAIFPLLGKTLFPFANIAESQDGRIEAWILSMYAAYSRMSRFQPTAALYKILSSLPSFFVSALAAQLVERSRVALLGRHIGDAMPFRAPAKKLFFGYDCLGFLSQSIR